MTGSSPSPPMSSRRPRTMASPPKCDVEVKTDDSTDKVVAESLDQAIKKIKEQIEVIKKETKPGEQQKVRVKSTRERRQAARELGKTDQDTQTDRWKKEEVRRAIVNRVGKIEEIRTAKEEVRRAIVQTPEMRAEIDKARAKVKELSELSAPSRKSSPKPRPSCLSSRAPHMRQSAW